MALIIGLIKPRKSCSIQTWNDVGKYEWYPGTRNQDQYYNKESTHSLLFLTQLQYTSPRKEISSIGKASFCTENVWANRKKKHSTNCRWSKCLQLALENKNVNLIRWKRGVGEASKTSCIIFWCICNIVDENIYGN